MNIVNRKSTAIAFATAAIAASAALGGNAFAQEATYELPKPFVSSITRAEVRAEVLQARAEGTLNVTEADFQERADFVPTKTRTQVKAEARAYNGLSRALTAEPHGFDVKLSTAA